jgi:hydroxymethylglutaryl-CoA synthase
MVGITSIGTYIPMYRLKREEITRMWKGKAQPGEKAVAGYDEDSITMAVAATLDCLKNNTDKVDALYFATTTSPYQEKQSAAIIAGVADINNNASTADFSNSLRACTSALKAAFDAIQGGSASSVVVTAADSRMGAVMGNFEQLLGDAAVSLKLGTNNVVASLEGRNSVYSDFTDYWRTSEDKFMRSAEGRFIDEVGYLPVMQESINGLFKKCNMTATDFNKIVYYANDARQHLELAKRCGFQPAQLQMPLFDQIGNTGNASVFLMLAAALENSKAGDKILVASYGDGSDVFYFRVTEAIESVKKKASLALNLNRKQNIEYGRYLFWRDLIPAEASTLPDRLLPSLPSRWRERRGISGLYGFKCKKCGTPQISPIGQVIRICVNCHAQDEFEPYRFSDRTGEVTSYAIDVLQPTRNPPGINGVINFDGGGRLLVEFTDTDPEKMKTGMKVEMTFRKMYQIKGIIDYYWKARPVSG